MTDLVLTPAEVAEAQQLIGRLSQLLSKAAAPAPLEVPKSGLRDVDWADAASAIGCDVAAIKAVWEVECGPDGAFGPDGRPTVLWEGHQFSKRTGRKYDTTHGGVSWPKWDRSKYPKGDEATRNKANWDKIIYASKLDRDAAYMSASFGAPQIMGFNYADCAFGTVHEFVAAMSRSERDQLLTFTQLIVTWGLGDEMRDRRWAAFALRYNGESYAANKYDTKLAAAYAKWS